MNENVSERGGPVTESEILKSWLLFAVCAVVGGFLAGIIAGAAVGIVMGLAGIEESLIRAAGAVAGFLASLPVSYFSFRYFVLRLIARTFPPVQGANPPPLPRGGLES